jgi:hypothetical protein
MEKTTRKDKTRKCGAFPIFYLLSIIFYLTACVQPGGPGAPAQGAEQVSGGSSGDSGDSGKDERVRTGIRVASLPDITIYGRNQMFDPAGLVVVWTYDGGDEEDIPASEYTLTAPDMGKYAPQRVTVKAGGFEDRFSINVMDSDRTLTSLSVNTAYRKEQVFYSDFNKTGLVVTANYSDGFTENVTSYANIIGYDKTKRGSQANVVAKVNGKPVPIPDISVRLPASMKASMFFFLGDGAMVNNYRRVYIKGESMEMAHARFRVEAETASGKVALTYENGGILDTDTVSGYSPNNVGTQNLTLHLDGVSVPFDVSVVNVEPAVWFDYGYRRTSADPSGMGVGLAGKYHAAKGETLVLSPTRYLIGYGRDHHDTGATYTWSVSGGSFSTPSAGSGEFFSYTPTGVGTSTVTVTVTGKSYVTGESISKTATAEVVCYGDAATTQHPDPKPAEYANLCLVPGMGQYAAGGNGFGWSLGSIGGYEVWRVGHRDKYRITGNPLGAWGEPGAIWVQEDRNGNDLPDEMWYELKGSEDDPSKPGHSMMHRRYGITFMEAGSEGLLKWGASSQMVQCIYYVDSWGRADVFFSQWPETSLSYITFTTTLVRNAVRPLPIMHTIEGGAGGMWGYVDVPYTPSPDGSYDFDEFPIKRAIRADGTPVTLTNVRFIKVQTACFGYGSIFGDLSTEIYSADFLGKQTDFPLPEESY